MTLHQLVSSLRHNQQGSALVEFAASATLLILIVFGIMETSRALYVDNFVSNSAREAVRYAMVRGAGWNGAPCTSINTSNCTATAADINSYITSLAPMGVFTSPSSLTVNTSWPGTSPSGAPCSAQGIRNSPGCLVQVQVSYDFNFIMPFMPRNTLVLNASSAMVISQ